MGLLAPSVLFRTVLYPLPIIREVPSVYPLCLRRASGGQTALETRSFETARFLVHHLTHQA
jgi:hypothetical protein